MHKNVKDFEEKTLSKRTIYGGRMIQLEELTVRLPDGREASREVVRHPGAVAVLAETEEGTVVVVHQWRKAIDQLMLEIPAGKLEPGEDPEVCAVRELQEETGFSANHFEQIARFYTSPGFADETLTLYYASGLSAGDAKPDDDEFLDIDYLTYDEVQHLLENQQVSDVKTLVAFQWWIAQKQQG